LALLTSSGWHSPAWRMVRVHELMLQNHQCSWNRIGEAGEVALEVIGPQAGLLPLAADGSVGDGQRFRDLGFRRAGRNAQLYDTNHATVHLCHGSVRLPSAA